MIFTAQALALFLNTLLVTGNGEAVIAPQATENPFHGLQYIYGKEQLEIHELDNIPRIQSRRGLQEVTNEQRSLHVACSDYNQATDNERFLKLRLGEQNVYPAYVSESANAVCFAIFMKPSIASAVQDLPSIQSVVQVPTELKINHLILSSLGFSGKSSISSKKPKLHEFLFSKLILFGGVGLLKSPPPSDEFVTTADLKSLLSSDLDPVTFLDSLSAEIAQRQQSSDANLWTKMRNKLSASSATCPFNRLVVESSSSGTIAIDGLKDFMEGITDTSMTAPCMASLLAVLVQQKGVSDIHYHLPKSKFNEHGKSIIQTEGFTTSFPYTNAGIDGTGQVVGIGDTGVDELSCFFRNTDSSKVARSSASAPTFDTTKRKVIQYISYADDHDTEGGHGTHVSGTVAGHLIGSDTTYESDNGHASGAKIAFFDMEISSQPEKGILYPEPFDDYVLSPAYNAGARLHTNSWGSGFNFYDETVLSIDYFSVVKTDFLALFAASNDGAEGYYSIGSPAVSKNALTVGATRSSSASEINSVAFFSSIGPTYDNRIKPDVVAPGFYTISAKAAASTTAETCDVVSMAGTSMATPATAGAAAQVRSYFANSKSFNCRYISGTTANADCSSLTNLRGATVKALLIQSGEPITQYDSSGEETTEPTATLSTTPDMYQGFGRVSLKNILPYSGIEENLKIVVTEHSISAGNRITYTVTVSDSSLPLKATLVWMDPLNSVISTKMLLNDLDLQIRWVSGSQWLYQYGNGIQRDEYNNVEQVTIASPSGTYEISVSAAAYLTTTFQSFSLIIGSAGLTYSSQSTSSSYTVCGAYQELVKMTAMDHDGDGWDTGDSYLVQKSGVTITSGTMSGAVGNDFLKQTSMCLDEGDYTVQLIRAAGSGDSDSNEIGFEIDNRVYLSDRQTTGTFSVPAAICANPTLDLTLVGSLLGVPYGWNGETHYELEQTKGGDGEYEGTLVTGMVRDQSYCLSDGTWELTLNDLPKNDDFLDDYIGSYYGSEEYYLSASVSPLQASIDQKTKLVFTLEGGVLTDFQTKKVSGDGDDDDELSAGAAVAIALSIIVLVGAVIGCGLCYWNSKKKQTSLASHVERL